MTHRPGRATSPGFADPQAPGVVAPVVRTQRGPATDAPAVAPRPEAPAGAAKPKPRFVEVEVTHEHGPAPRIDPLRRAYEIWTQNHVYVLDSRLQCVEVRTRSGPAGVSKQDHPLVGSRLVGGQLQQNDSVEMSYPLPRPGSLAVFEVKKGKRKQYPRTSPVERIILRLNISTITGGDQVPSWDDVAPDERD